MLNIACIFLTLWINFSQASVMSEDMAYEKVAYRLELVRNQMDLTIKNRFSLTQDLIRQQRDFTGMSVFLRIPEARHDLKNDFLLVDSLRTDFQKLAEQHHDFRIRRIHLRGAWQKAPRGVPSTIPFDESYLIPEKQLVDSREVEIEIEFFKKAPEKSERWFRENQSSIRRLLEPQKKWIRKGNRLIGTAKIYRYRDIQLPQYIAPDLARYSTPAQPVTKSQQASAARILRYRQEIAKMWPEVQPCLNNVRTLVLNDQRMNFFFKHAKNME